jgi:hypothetical protein
MGTTPRRIPIKPGDRVPLELPYSEVCMHMRVAGRVMDVQLTDGEYPMAQLMNEDGSEFSLPVTTGEAGIYGTLRDGFYCYPKGDVQAFTEAVEAVDPLGWDPPDHEPHSR